MKIKEIALGLLPMFAMANPGPNVTSTPLLDQDGMEFNPNGNLASGDGKQVGQTPQSLVGFWGATPIMQPNSTGNVHTVAAGSVTNVFVNTTFDGSVGTKAYTIGDIVKALKNAGLLAT